jgi:phenylalanyl-tRNA synthetase beta subunit
MTINVNNDKNFNEIKAVFNNIDYLVSAECISIYAPDETKTNYTFNISFNHDNMTFKAEEIEVLVNKIVENIRNNGMEFNEGA